MRKHLIRLAVVLGASVSLALATVGIADANVPALFVGASPNGHGDCVGVILDQDGHYNVMDTPTAGYDAVLCAPGNTQSNFGWGHAGGEFIGAGHTVEEDAFVNGVWQFQRNVCACSGHSITRFISSTLLYRVEIVG